MAILVQRDCMLWIGKDLEQMKLRKSILHEIIMLGALVSRASEME